MDGSRFEYPFSCRRRISAGFPSQASLGSCRSAAVKACATCPMAAEQDSDLTGGGRFCLVLENLLPLIAAMKALRSWCFSGAEKLSKKGSLDGIPIEDKKRSHLAQDH